MAASVSRGGSIRGMVAAPVLPALGLPGAGLASSVRRRIFPTGWSGSWAGVIRWRSPTARKRYRPSDEKAMGPPACPPLPVGLWRHITSKFSSLAEVAVAVRFGRASAEPAPVLTRPALDRLETLSCPPAWENKNPHN